MGEARDRALIQSFSIASICLLVKVEMGEAQRY